MNARSYRIQAELFERFPGYVRGVVVAHGVANGSSPDSLVALLRHAEQSVRSRLDLERLTDDLRIKAWREAYRSFGAKPSEYRSSIEAMARRVLRGDPLPTINALVDIGNVVSLRHLLSAGGHAIDVLSSDIELRFAVGSETFVPFGSRETEHPLPGEVVFVEGDVVLTRRWTWRQADHTLILPETTAIEFNIDGLPPVAPQEVLQACHELAALITQHCGGINRVELLAKEHPAMTLAP
ncbi:MAG: phenylalanine--tRNA ligase beta subunit-related protein [Actinobacteria bacterium]|nr:phenylalanine--tRNA ligase beta subunit-related protein [Actinomycetota bacterium]